MAEHSYLFLALISLVLGSVAGFVMHRADFCIAGMFRNLFLFRDTFALRALILLVAVSMGLIEMARLLGLLSFYPYPLVGPPSLANLLGGAAFGVGMVLAGGCVIGTLYKVGAGSVVSFTALLGLIFGSALYAEVHPWWSALARVTTVAGGQITLPQFLNLSPTLAMAVGSFGLGLLLLRGVRQKGMSRSASVAGFLQLWQAALILAGLGLVSVLLVGMPLGLTATYTKLGAWIQQLFAPQHVASLAYYQTAPLEYLPPLASTPVRGGVAPVFDAIAAIQLPLIFGVVLGATVSARRLGEFKIYWRIPRRQYLSALVGGVIMGLACRMAGGCNLWHLLGGLPILAGSSLLFLAGIFPGAWLGSRLLVKLVLKSPPA